MRPPTEAELIGYMHTVVSDVSAALYVFRTAEGETHALASMNVIASSPDYTVAAAAFYYEALRMLSEGLGAEEHDLHLLIEEKVRGALTCGPPRG